MLIFVFLYDLYLFWVSLCSDGLFVWRLVLLSSVGLFGFSVCDCWFGLRVWVLWILRVNVYFVVVFELDWLFTRRLWFDLLVAVVVVCLLWALEC